MRMTGTRTWTMGLFVALMILMGASVAAAETLMMPDRDFLSSPTSEVVWGTTDLPTGSTYAFYFDDGTPDEIGTVSDGSYIAVNHQFQGSGARHVTLTVTDPGGTITEVANVTVLVYNGGTMTAEALRGLNVNRAIQDGLRYLWITQSNRQGNFPGGITTYWGNHPAVWSALIVAAFENHGYGLTNDNVPATGVYQKYIVERGLNFLADSLSAFTTSLQGTAMNDPCVGVDTAGAPIADPMNPGVCVALYLDDNPGYATSIAIQPLSSSSALNRRFPSALNGNVADKSYGEVLQRLVIGLAWGQGDDDFGDQGRGGWSYGFNYGSTDGSTMGWNTLALLDAQSVVSVPAFVKSEYQSYGFARSINADGSFDYYDDGDPNQNDIIGIGPNVARAGVAMQGMFYIGDNTYLSNSLSYITSRWNGTAQGNDYPYTCYYPVYTMNKGCAYGMYNVFKALKLQGVNTLPGIGRPAGPGSIPADDWYADYQDWLVGNQQNPTDVNGGGWGGAMVFSCCDNDDVANAALAELILAPVTLLLPDPTLFGTVGLSPVSATNPIYGDHTVTALVQSANNTPIPGATVVFTVLTGPNAGASGTCAPVSCASGANGQVSFTYHDSNAEGHDTIRASVGALQSNTVSKDWTATVALTPATAANPIYTDHTVTATVRGPGGVPIEDIAVAFTVLTGPNAGAAGTCSPVDCESDANGVVTFTYHDTNGPGHDTIRAKVGNAILSNVVSKDWSATVDLTPATAANPIYTDHTVTATVKGPGPNFAPVVGVAVNFAVQTGPNAGATGTCAPVSCVTNASGQVTFTYHDTNGPGHDTIRANVGTILSNVASKDWSATVDLTPVSATNPIFGDHTVTAIVKGPGPSFTPVAGVSVGFSVLTGPNAGAAGTCAPVTCLSDATGKVTFTYHDTNGAGHDTIRANVGTILSNVVSKDWTATITLSPPTATNRYTSPTFSTHTVTALVQGPGGAPISGATVVFSVVSGPNAGNTGTCAPANCKTDANGNVSFTYAGSHGAGQDSIRATVSGIPSNTVTKTWTIAKCDADSDGDIDTADLQVIGKAYNQPVSGPNDPRDGNSDGVINILDTRYCQLRLGQ